MKYDKIVKGIFIDRPNRFVAIVNINGIEEKCHVKNTGRCKELLIPGAAVILEDYCDKMGTRKMRYSLIAVYKNNMLVNMDSQIPNAVCEEALKAKKLMLPGMDNLIVIKREKTYGSSRFDFYIEDEKGRKGFLEVKGVTLEENGTASFPDAPTERGVKHVKELIKAKHEGHYGGILFVIQMENANCFMPNDKTHKAFGDSLRQAYEEGVSIIARKCFVKEDIILLDKDINVMLNYTSEIDSGRLIETEL